MIQTSERALRPSTLAHRGAAALAPENTLASITTALELGADYIEIDVRQSRDERLVVIHDEAVDRTTNGTGVVGDLPFDTVQLLDAGSWYYPTGTKPPWEVSRLRVPTLEGVLEIVRGRAGICIELKQPHLYPGMEQRVLDRLAAAGMLEGQEARRVILQSFSVGTMRLLELLAPQLSRFQLIAPRRELTEQDLTEISGYATGIGLHRESVTPELVTAAHSRSLRVHCYTVNSPLEMRSLLRMGVDGLISDNLVELKVAVRQHADGQSLPSSN